MDTGRAGRAPKGGSDPAELVHEARKTIKRMRALARLLRDELGEQEFRRVNDSLRGAGRRLAGARDAQVRLATLNGLVERHPKALAREGIERLRQRLEGELEQTVEPADRDRVLEDIATMRRQVARWNLLERDFQALAPGLGRIYREGHRRYARVEHEHARDPQDLHDWRKRVKSLYYALDMLGAKQVKGTRRATRQANRLGELLGEEHDLWMLSVYLEEYPGAFGRDTGARDALGGRIERRRKRLRKRALGLGARLYRHKPGKFTRRAGSALSP
ncbi:MAG TPA: CHAD domain-containing protein [Solirubrobacteraceae bacterium]|nr:CHAD domain-containing protein [Solirubrobacteraceae bacterium]